MRRFVLLLGLLACPLPDSAWALTATPTGATVRVTYDEPTQNRDGSALVDLGEIRLFYQIGTAGEVECAVVPATAATGGGVDQSADCQVPVADGQEVDVAFFGYAHDTSGNRSVKSEVVIKRIDFLPPDTIR